MHSVKAQLRHIITQWYIVDGGLVPVEKLHSIYDGFSPLNIFGNLSSLYLKSYFYKDSKDFLKLKKKSFFSLNSIIDNLWWFISNKIF